MSWLHGYKMMLWKLSCHKLHYYIQAPCGSHLGVNRDASRSRLFPVHKGLSQTLFDKLLVVVADSSISEVGRLGNRAVLYKVVAVVLNYGMPVVYCGLQLAA